MPITNREYDKLVKQTSPGSKKLKNCLLAFLVGGAICALGELLVHMYQWAGLTKEQVDMAVPMTLIVLAALSTGLKLFDKLAKHAGAGTLVPITGFANAMVSPAIEFKKEGHVMGIGAKMFSIAGPVLVFGITASAVYGLILCVFQLF